MRNSRKGLPFRSLHQKAQQRAAGRGLQFLRVNRPVVVCVSFFEDGFDVGEILVLADRLVIVRVGYLPVSVRNPAVQFSKQSHCDPHPPVDCDGLPRPERLRIGDRRAGHELSGLDQDPEV